MIMLQLKDQKCADCGKPATWIASGESGLIYSACNEHQQEIKKFAMQTEKEMMK